MDRRDALLALAALLPASAVRAQASKPARVGLFLSYGAGGEPNVRAVAAALFGAHGFVEGRNLAISLADYGDRPAQREALARELVAERPDVILVAGSRDALLMQRLTGTIPVVFAGVADPERLGLVEALARPGRNVTGASSRYGDLLGKRFELLKALVPGLRRVVVIETTGPAAQLLQAATQDASARLGISLERISVPDDSRPSVDAMFAALARSRAEGLVFTGVRSITFAAELLSFLRKAAMPAVFGDHELVTMGGLMSLGERDEDAYQRAVGLAARILRGADPATLPVDQLARPHLAINLSTARALKLAFPESIRVSADQVVD
jgi:putative ABC transport system substrate-binding protein